MQYLCKTCATEDCFDKGFCEKERKKNSVDSLVTAKFLLFCTLHMRKIKIYYRQKCFGFNLLFFWLQVVLSLSFSHQESNAKCFSFANFFTLKSTECVVYNGRTYSEYMLNKLKSQNENAKRKDTQILIFFQIKHSFWSIKCFCCMCMCIFMCLMYVLM